MNDNLLVILGLTLYGCFLHLVFNIRELTLDLSEALKVDVRKIRTFIEMSALLIFILAFVSIIFVGVVQN